MNYRDINLTVGEVVAYNPAAKKIFKKYGIDFCCGGNRKLMAVAGEQGLDYEAICRELDMAKKDMERVNELDITELSPLALSEYINDRHHSYMRKALPETAELLLTIVRVHGANHPELFELYKLFGNLRTDLEQHLLKEETMLFPAFEAEKERQDDIRSLSAVIISEHEAAGEILSKLREISRDYTLPDDACPTFARAYKALEEIEQDLHQHIHLENNILLKEYDQRSKE